MGDGVLPTVQPVPDLSKFVSSDEDINDDRKNAVMLIKKYSKTPIIAQKSDRDWFWGDLDIEWDQELEEEAKEIVRANYNALEAHYPFQISEWFVNWYRYMPEIIDKHIRGTGQIDWNLFFSLAYPLKTCGAYSFQTLIQKLNFRQAQDVRQQIYQDCYDNPKLRQAIINGDVIPPIYTYYTPYSKIRKEVLKKVREGSKTLVIDDSSKELFTQAAQLVEEQGLSTQEALAKAEKSMKENSP